MESSISDKTSQFLTKALVILTFLWGTYHLITTRYYLMAPAQHNNFHLICAIAVIYLLYLIENPSLKRFRKLALFFDSLMFCLMLISAVYIHTQYKAITLFRPFTQTTCDILIGVFIIVSILYFTWRKWGPVIPILCIAALFYLKFGTAFGAGSIFYHSDVTIKRLIAMQSTFFTGVYGSLLETSATVLVMYVLFGAVLTKMGALNMIVNIIQLFAGESACSAAQLAVLGSAAFGSISGASAANVAVTGSMTIPMMKKRGLPASFAGAVESVASTGGGIMPPIMGATAFLLASLAGVSYFQVVIIATVPAVLFYGSMVIQVYLRCRKLGLPGDKCCTRNRCRMVLSILGKNLFVLIPFFALIFFMARGVSVTMTGLYSILLAFIIRFLHFLLIEHKKLKESGRQIWEEYWQSLKEGGEMMASIAIIMACLGMFVEAMVGTGIGNRLSFVLVEMSKGNLYLLLILMAVVCILLGSGLPTIPAYLLVAIIGAPALKDLGIPLLLAHYFVLFYANLSQVTPPVGISSLVAAKLAEESYTKVGVASVKLMIPILFIPMLFVTYNGLGGLSYVGGNIFILLFDILISVFCLTSLCISIEGYLFTGLILPSRILLIALSLTVFTKNMFIIGGGATVFAAICVLNFIRYKRLSQERAEKEIIYQRKKQV